MEREYGLLPSSPLVVIAWASLAPIEYPIPPRMEEFRHALPALPRLWASWAGVSSMGQLNWMGRSDCCTFLVLIKIVQNRAPGNCLASLLDLAVIGVEEVAARLINVVWTEMVEVRVRF